MGSRGKIKSFQLIVIICTVWGDDIYGVTDWNTKRRKIVVHKSVNWELFIKLQII